MLQYVLKRHRYGGWTEIWVHNSHGWRPCYVNVIDGVPIEVDGSPTAHPAAQH